MTFLALLSAILIFLTSFSSTWMASLWFLSSAKDGVYIADAVNTDNANASDGKIMAIRFISSSSVRNVGLG